MGAKPSTSASLPQWRERVAAASGANVVLRVPAQTTVRGLIIDMPDVLYDATLWRRWLLRLVHRLGCQTDYASFFQPWESTYLKDVCCGRREYGEAFQAFLLASGLSWGQVDELEAASALKRESLEVNVRPLPGVVPTLKRLHAMGLKLAAWADSPQTAGGLAERLERLGLGGLFHAVLSSFDLEATQPMSRCYQALTDELELAADEVLYLGHDADHLAGAQTFGLWTAAFNYQPLANADVFLNRFEDLHAVAQTLSAGKDAKPCPTLTPGGLP